ncbi:7900_t:CDS:1 [Racocetra fulgida]|uniref:7900_t:CDS:1 n=1 Tax=Racocetra fulgida TaxID=60492 RepID=A0A9N8VFM6_9GLOM|nr:7900_t:CDS:1 [Racocetra fulgida]
MVNIKTTLDELKNIINDLKSHAENASAWNTTDKSNLEKRINHLLDKSNPRHTNLSQDLDTDLKDIEQIDKSIGAEKIKTDQEIKKLQDEKTQLQTDITAKDALIKQKNEEIGDKLTSDFITKLENLTKDGIKLDDTKINEIKTIIEEIKNKGLTANLTDTNTKLEEMKGKIDKIQPDNKTIY